MKLYETLENQLKKEPNFVSDNGELKKWVMLDKAQNFDEELNELLLDNDELKEMFFCKCEKCVGFQSEFICAVFGAEKLLERQLHPIQKQSWTDH